ncbi:MFS transporter [Tomitella fengzijianii]|uniref:MFS transporter n=1 Tax=Tomitella fengzijianii TaxID=2597660 RepID=A0A516X4Q6_9ACTN|nr:MFS transporter [Tomitella fengzijianii]QDQ98055.1 MFS transporter [Tomitella fengzijianii]
MDRDGAMAGSRRRWFVLALVGLAQLMIVLDLTVMNIALPDAQRDLHFSDIDRQWVITSYALAFGSLLLLGGRIGDLFGRKRAFIIGLVGFAAASAVGGASVGFVMLVVARACQGVFGALLAPAALSILTVTFTDAKERGKAFGVFGAIVAAGGLIGLLLGGALTEYLSWRWCLYINLAIAAVAVVGAVFLLTSQRDHGQARLDFVGVIAGSVALFCLVYGFSNAASHSWDDTATLAFLAVGVALMVFFAFWQTRAHFPLLPPRVVLDRNRGASYLAVLLTGAAMFGIFLFLTYYLQTVLGYSPLRTGVAFLPMIGSLALSAQLSNVVLMPRIGPKALVGFGMLIAAGAMVWLTGITADSSYASAVLGPIMVGGVGIGLSMPSAMNTGTFGVQPSDAGVASATLNVGQQVGGSIGTALLNTIATSAVTGYIAAHAASARPTPAVQAAAAVHGYTTAFWWTAGIFALGGIVCGTVLRWGPLTDGPAADPGPAGSSPAQARSPQ